MENRNVWDFWSQKKYFGSKKSRGKIFATFEFKTFLQTLNSNLSAQNPQHPRARLCQENGQAPQMIMLVITRKNTNHRLTHPLYEHSRV